MARLSQILERIMLWLEQTMPDYASSFLPGLSSHEIREIEERLGTSFPQEFYELYQWRNGTQEDSNSLIFPVMQFMPLEEVGDVSEEIEHDSTVRALFTFEGNRLLPFIADEGRHCAIIIDEKNKETSPIALIGKQGSMPYIAYTSIRNMMLILAECYENGAYYINDEGYVDADEAKVNKIKQKHS